MVKISGQGRVGRKRLQGEQGCRPHRLAVPTGLQWQIPYPFSRPQLTRGLAHLCSWLCAQILGHRNKLIILSYLKKLKSLKKKE